MKVWKDEEVLALFRAVENCKLERKSLKIAFSKHAETFNRKTNSVRNYYYKEVDCLVEDKSRCKRLGIDIGRHSKNRFVCFEKDEEESMSQQIEKLTNSGMSVRAACFKISNGDLTMMTRLQNKYQNLKKNNIIQFRQRQKSLTESELNSLFMGLVRLIKKNAVDEYAQKNTFSNDLMKKVFDDLNKKDSQILELKSSLERLKKQNQELLTEIDSNKKRQSFQQHLTKKHISKMLEK